MNATGRVEALRRRLAEEALDALIVCDVHNVRYLTGFDGVFDSENAHAAVISASELALYTDSRYAEALGAVARETEWDVRVPPSNLYVTLCAELRASGVTRTGIESSVPYGRFRFISEELDGALEAVEQYVEDIRQTKASEEIGRIEAAQQLTDAAFDHVLPLVRAGATEVELVLELEFFMRKNGSDGVAFDPIVASGPNSALPHARVSTRELAAGDFVVMDFGARVDGYCADMTRTLVVGAATERHREIYDAVLAAHAAGISAVKPGLPGSAIDAAAREVLEGRGFGAYFGHGLGHGLGLEVHEAPSVGPRGTKSVREGSVITIEPGVYLPGFGGVRIEDLVVVESGGARVLTRSAKHLIEV